MFVFTNRRNAGQKLATVLGKYANKEDVIILALPRGGVPVAYEVAKSLNAPLDVFIVRKLGVPFHEEYAMGAIALDGTIILDNKVINQVRVSSTDIEKVVRKEKAELERRNKEYRKGRDFPNIKNKTIIIVDDGIATGATIKAAATSLRKHDPKQIIIAAPVGSKSTCMQLREVADEVICLSQPENFYAVGQVYSDFSQTTDREVHELLSEFNEHQV